MLFRKALSLTLITQFSIFILGILNTILIVRAIGAQGRGVYSILLTSVSILAILSSGGIIWSNTYWIGKKRERARYIFPNALYQTIFVFLVILFLTFVVSENILRIVIEGIPKEFVYLSTVLVFLELGILHLNSILLGLQDFKKYNLISISRLALFIPLNLVFLYGLRMNLEGVIYSWMISAALPLSLGLLGLVKKLQIQEFKMNFSQLIKSLKIGGRALLINVLGQLLLRSDLFLINWYLGLKAVGYYSVGVAVAELVFKIPGIAGDILFPKVAANDSFQSVNLVTKITRFLGIPLILVTFILIFCGKQILSIAFGIEFIQSYIPMIWMVFGTLVLSYHVILDNYFAGKGYPAVTVWAPGLTLVINIGLNLLLIPKYGISGAAMSSCFAYIFLTAIKFIVFQRENQVTYQEFFILNRKDVSEFKMILNLNS